MSVRNIERAFNALHSQHNEEAALADPAQARVQQAQTEADRLRSLSTSMTTADVIERILLHYAERDYFRWEVKKSEALSILSDGGRGDALFQSEVCWADVVEWQLAHLVMRSHRLLELPAPEADVLGNVTWQGTALEVSKAYRRLSVLVHPDKNPGEDARKAFEALNEAHRVLKDADKRVGGDALRIFERNMACDGKCGCPSRQRMLDACHSGPWSGCSQIPASRTRPLCQVNLPSQIASAKVLLPICLPTSFARPFHLQDTLLKEHLDAALGRRWGREARATLEERVALNAAQAQEAAALRKQEVHGGLWRLR